ncbi:Protein of unknown function [Gryllus bimaculatus]|nr:Protein of unknown function [Gryllus bimaculatus]
MPVLPSHPGLCGTACPYRCDDPLSFAEIEFRLPGGATHTHCFTARTTIHQVREYVQANLELPFGTCKLDLQPSLLQSQ